MIAEITLAPHQAKRVIARAVAGLPEVTRAWRKGLIALRPSTSAMPLVEELTGWTGAAVDDVGGDAPARDPRHGLRAAPDWKVPHAAMRAVGGAAIAHTWVLGQAVADTPEER